MAFVGKGEGGKLLSKRTMANTEHVKVFAINHETQLTRR